jgi:hypothetical protein
VDLKQTENKADSAEESSSLATMFADEISQDFLNLAEN